MIATGPADLPTFTYLGGPGDSSLPAPALTPAREATAYVIAHVRELMGMPITIQVRGPRARSAAVTAVVDHAYADLAWADATFSTWKADSELSRLRRGELTMDECCREMQQVADLCDDFAAATGGAFSATLPDADGTWRYDPTGLVKGWAIARAAEILAADPALAGHAWCVNAGGDIAVGGVDTSPGGDRPWRLGIEDPDQPGRIAEVIELREGALATSGCAARGAHLIDPTTGEAVARRGSVSVVAPDVISADVWATALFVGPHALEERLARRDGWQVVRL